jgi:hypothetical protein
MKKPHPLAARIKRVMQADEEVGKIAQATPFLMGEPAGAGAALLRPRPAPRPVTAAPRPPERALELFLQHLCGRAAAVAQERGAKTVTPSHL